jgi:arsenite-transporting ATPase
MRILLFTGKGGVGKTTIASATGIKTAELGYKTLIISTDPAHSLSDAFQKELKPYPTEVMENLYAMEVNVEYELERHWDAIKEYLTIFFKSQGIEDVVAEELAIFPGFDELASLLHLLNHYEKRDFDVVILDCAPTGETLRLLSVPEVAKWYMNRFFGIEKRLLKIVRPIAEPLMNVPLPSDEVLNKIQELYSKISLLKDILESEITSVRIVMNPEKMVIRESERAFTYLNLFGYSVDCVIVNKVFPTDLGDYLSKWVEIQRTYLKEIEDRFPIPIFKVRFREREVVGDELLKLAENIYDGRDPTEVFYKHKPIEIKKEGDFSVMSIRVPFIEKKDLKLLKRGEELIVIAKNWKRTVFLPQSLALKEVVKAEFRDEWLKIYFS